MYIYLIINTVNGKTYIGKREKSSEVSKNYFGSGIRLKNAIKKYGKDKFRKFIIDENKNYSRKELSNLEIEYISNLKPDYNISVGGEGGNTLSNHPNKKAIIEKIKASHQTSEYRKKIGIKSKRNWKDPKYREKMDKYFKSDKNLEKIKKMHDGNKKFWKNENNKKKYIEENLIGDKNPFFGKYHSKESKLKMSNSIKEKWKNQEYKAKMCIASKNRIQPKGSLNKNSKLVTDKQYYLIVINYLNNVSITEITKLLKLTSKVVYNRLKWIGLKK